MTVGELLQAPGFIPRANPVKVETSDGLLYGVAETYQQGGPGGALVLVLHDTAEEDTRG